MPLFYVTVEVIRTVTVEVRADNVEAAKRRACDDVTIAADDVEYDSWCAEATHVMGQNYEEVEDDE